MTSLISEIKKIEGQKKQKQIHRYRDFDGCQEGRGIEGLGEKGKRLRC